MIRVICKYSETHILNANNINKELYYVEVSDNIASKTTEAFLNKNASQGLFNMFICECK